MVELKKADEPKELTAAEKEQKAKDRAKPYKASVRQAASARHPAHGTYKLDENDRAGPVFAKPYGSEPLEQPAVTYDDEGSKKPQAKAKA